MYILMVDLLFMTDAVRNSRISRFTSSTPGYARGLESWNKDFLIHDL
jgi:hypothetical protein